MASERATVKWLIGKLKEHKAFYQRFEDKFAVGIPDLMFVDTTGECTWVEVKNIRDFPVRMTTVVHSGIRTGQGLWLTKALAAGMKCYVLIQVSSELFLFDRVPDKWNKQEFYQNALLIGRSEVKKWLQK